MERLILTLSDNPVKVVLGPDDYDSRTITGVAVPWNVEAAASTGPVKFLPGSLPTDGPAPKFIRDHDLSQPLGVVVERYDTGAGMRFVARVSATQAGDEALILASDGVLDAVSVGVDPTDFYYEGRTMVVKAGRWRELSLLPFGAYAEAVVDSVHASEAEPEPETEPDPHPIITPPEEPTMDTQNVEAAPAPIAPITLIRSERPNITAGEYFADYLAGRIQAANQTSADGVLPVPVLLPLYDGLAVDRPLTASFGVEAMPATGKTFSIPKITQRPTVGVQAAEFDTLSSQAMIVDEVITQKASLGGFVDVSEQDVDWTIPAALDLVVSQLAKAYAAQTETAACSALISGATVTDTITDWTDADEVLTAIFTAASTIVSATGEMPTTIWCAPDKYVALATLKSTAGDYLFPALNPMNGYGRLDAASLQGTPAGLRLVVSPKFAAGSFVVGNPSGMRIFEDRKGTIQVAQPATMSVRIAWRGYFATAFMSASPFVKFV